MKRSQQLLLKKTQLLENNRVLVQKVSELTTKKKHLIQETSQLQHQGNLWINQKQQLLAQLSENQNIKLSYADINKLATILVRHTIGFGLIEVLLFF